MNQLIFLLKKIGLTFLINLISFNKVSLISVFLFKDIEAIQNKHAMQIENYQSQIDHLKS